MTHDHGALNEAMDRSFRAMARRDPGFCGRCAYIGYIIGSIEATRLDMAGGGEDRSAFIAWLEAQLAAIPRHGQTPPSDA